MSKHDINGKIGDGLAGFKITVAGTVAEALARLPEAEALARADFAL